MKFTVDPGNGRRYVTVGSVAEAVAADGRAVPSMHMATARLIDKLIAKGLLTAHDVSDVFNYDIIAED